MSRFLKASAFVASVAGIAATVYGIAYFLKVNIDLLWLSFLAVPLPMIAGAVLLSTPALVTMFLCWREYQDYYHTSLDAHTHDERLQAFSFFVYAVVAGASAVGGLTCLWPTVMLTAALPALPVAAAVLTGIGMAALGASVLGLWLARHRNKKICATQADSQLHSNQITPEIIARFKGLSLEQFYELDRHIRFGGEDIHLTSTENPFDYLKANTQLQGHVLSSLEAQKSRMQQAQLELWCERMQEATTIESLSSVMASIKADIAHNKKFGYLFNQEVLSALFSDESEMSQYYQHCLSKLRITTKTEDQTARLSPVAVVI